MGSWKTIATSPPRSRLSSPFGIRSRSRPLYTASPRTIRPGGCGISPRTASILTLFPEPDSPTIPSVSPAAMSYVTFSTAWTTPSSVLNSTVRSRIERTGSGTNSLSRVERAAQPVTYEVDAEHDEHDRQAREGHEPPVVGRDVLPVGDELPECRRRRLHAEAEVREVGLEQDGAAERECREHDDRPERVREHVPEHDAQVTRSGGLGRIDVLLLAKREE